MIDLINITLDNSYNIQASINIWIILTLVFLSIFVYLYYYFKTGLLFNKSLEINGAEIGMRDQKIQLKPNYDDAQIAFKLWVELSTRKIGLQIDYENDVILEIYNSWYEFFKITRELIKSIPITKIRKNNDSYKLVEIAIDVLNSGIRPHLTKWQAKFRRWYSQESEKSENAELSPQELQKKFPNYIEMIDQMKIVNKKLMKYREILRDIALGKKS
jgi:hypothetical protein